MSPQIETYMAFPSVESICAQSAIRRIRLNPEPILQQCMTTKLWNTMEQSW